MDTITIQGDAVPLVKSGLEVERSILKLSLEEYRNQLKAFEKRHRMSSRTFIKKFESGALGDEGKWFDWLFAYKAYNHAKDRLNIFREIKFS